MELEEKRDFLEKAIRELVATNRCFKAEKYLLNYNFIRKKVLFISVLELIEDYKLVLKQKIIDEEKKDALKILLSSLEQVIHILKDYPKQINSQLIGFLEKNSNTYTDTIIDVIDEKTKNGWLRPMIPSLASQQGGLIKSYVGHKNDISAIAYLADPKLIFSGTKQGTIKVWKKNTTECISTIYSEEDVGSIFELKVIDNNYLLSLSSTNQRGDFNILLHLIIWDFKNEKIYSRFSWSGALIKDSENLLNISNCNRRLIIGNINDKKDELLIFNIPSLKLIQRIKSKKQLDDLVLFKKKHHSKKKKKESLIVISSFLGNREITYVKKYRFFLGKYRLIGLSRVPNLRNCRIKIYTESNIALLWNIFGDIILGDIKKREILFEMLKKTEKGQSIHNVIVTSDYSKIILFLTNKIEIWETKNGSLIKELKGYHHKAKYELSEEENKLYTWSLDDKFKIWNLKTGEIIKELEGWKLVHNIKFVGENQILSHTFLYSREVHLWDLNKVKSKNEINHSERIVAIKSYDNDTKIVTASADKTLKIIDLNTLTQKTILKGHKIEISDIDILKRGETYYLLSVSGVYLETKKQNVLKIWNLSTYECLDTLYEHKCDIVKVKSLLNGYYAITLSTDFSAKYWDLITGECIATFFVSSAKDGRYIKTFEIFDYDTKLITGSGDGLLRIWSLTSGKLLNERKEHSKTINSIDIDSTGRFVLTCSYDKTVQIWDLEKNISELALKNLKGFSKATFLELDIEFDYIEKWNKISKSIYSGYILVASDNLLLCNLNSQKIIVFETKNIVNDFIILFDEHRVITIESGDNGKIILWDLLTSKEISSISIGRYIFTTTYVKSKKMIIAGESTGQIHFIKIIEEAKTSLRIIHRSK